MIIRLVAKEILHRKVNFILAALAVATAVTLYVAFVMTGTAADRETRKIMLELGQNMRIIPRGTQKDKLLLHGFSDKTMPADYANRFMLHKGFSYTHLTATLHKSIEWRGQSIVLTGIMPELNPADKPQKPLPTTFSIKPGTAYIGAELVATLAIEQGDTIDISGTKLTVIRCLSPTGVIDDIRIYTSLADAQRILDLPGRINEIKALECLCIIEASKEPVDPLALAQQQLEILLPEAEVILLEGIAKIRQQQRAAIQGHVAFIIVVIAIVCGVVIAVVTMTNVHDRKTEIGLLRSLGYGSGKIAALFLTKAVLIGLIGAVVGYYVGTFIAIHYGTQIFRIAAKTIVPNPALLAWALVTAPLFAAVASFIPVATALTADPADTLREE